MRLHEAGEDYLEAILRLNEISGNVRSVDVAKFMNVSKPSVSHAVNLLHEGGFLWMDNENYLHLTELGLEVAEEIYGRHRFFRHWLLDAGVSPEVAEEEACRMEHTISADSFLKLKARAAAYKLK